MQGRQPRRSATSSFAGRALWLCLALAGCGKQETEQREFAPDASFGTEPIPLESLRTHPRLELADGLELPRVGTIGDLPPPTRRVVLRIDGQGALAVDDRPTSESGLDRLVQSRAGRLGPLQPWRDDNGVDVLLAIDRVVPWAAVLRVMKVVARGAATSRVHFLVLPEGEGDPGAMAAFLPSDAERRFAPALEGSPARVRAVIGDGPDSPWGELFATLHALPTEQRNFRVDLTFDPMIPTGSALAITDQVFRAGFLWVGFAGVTEPLAELSIRDLVTRARSGTPHIRFEVDDDVVSPAPSGMIAIPPIPRVVGRPAGDWAPRDAGIPTSPLRLTQIEVDETEETEGRGTAQVHPPTAPAEKPNPAVVPSTTARARPYRPVTVDPAGLGLRWLAAHQSPDGRFEAQGFRAWCHGERNDGVQPSGPGFASSDLETTALSLFAFIGAGYTSRSEGAFGVAVTAAARWLVSNQGHDGAFEQAGARGSLRDHALATHTLVALAERTAATRWLGPAQRALDFAASVCLPDGGWEARVGEGTGDPVTTTWMTLAFLRARSAQRPGVASGQPLFVTDAAVIQGACRLAARTLDPASGPMNRAPDVPRLDRGTPAALVTLLLVGEPAAAPASERWAAFLVAAAPSRASPGAFDAEAVWFGSLAAYRLAGPAWMAWEPALKSGVVATQLPKGDVCATRGSWEPTGASDLGRGRVAVTALLTLASQIYYRYPVIDRIAPP